MSSDRRTLADYERHVKRFGPELVFETASEDLSRSELRRLAEQLRRADPSFRVAGDRERAAAYQRVKALIDRRRGLNADLEHDHNSAAARRWFAERDRIDAAVAAIAERLGIDARSGHPEEIYRMLADKVAPVAGDLAVCAAPGCLERFCPTRSGQLYHNTACRMRAKRARDGAATRGRSVTRTRDATPGSSPTVRVTNRPAVAGQIRPFRELAQVAEEVIA